MSGMLRFVICLWLVWYKVHTLSIGEREKHCPYISHQRASINPVWHTMQILARDPSASTALLFLWINLRNRLHSHQLPLLQTSPLGSFTSLRVRSHNAIRNKVRQHHWQPESLPPSKFHGKLRRQHTQLLHSELVPTVQAWW